MRKRLLVVAAVIVLALGVAVAVWASGGTSDSGPGKSEDCEKTITVQDTGSPKMMEYRRQDCDDEFAVTRSQGGGG